MKVLLLTNVPSPYRILFFNELGRHCELTVLFQKKRSSERDAKWAAESSGTYTSIYLKGKSTGVDNAFCPEVVQYLKDKSYDRIVICGIASPTEMLAIAWCKLHHRKYCLESDGGFAKDGHGLKEKIKRLLIQGADLYFSTGVENDKYYQFYGANSQKIVRYSFTSLRKADIIDRLLTEDEKQRIKENRNIAEKEIALTIGQFIYRKGFDILLKAWSYVQQDDWGLYIIGGEPTPEYQRLIEEYSLKNVHFVGFLRKDEISEYYQAADLFVLPTREDIWGLVINEAMAYGLPVITTDRCGAGVELVDNTNGRIIKADNESALASAMDQLMHMNLETMAKKSLQRIQKYTIEDMVKEHIYYLKGKLGDEET